MTKTKRWIERLREKLAPTVPDDTANCEFECRRLHCTPRRYAVCPRRRRGANPAAPRRKPRED